MVGFFLKFLWSGAEKSRNSITHLLWQDYENAKLAWDRIRLSSFDFLC
jgi:hypothetical protein